MKDPELDYYNYKTVNNKKSREVILKYTAESNLIDPFRELNPSLRRYSWRRSKPILQQARLDLFLISENF